MYAIIYMFIKGEINRKSKKKIKKNLKIQYHETIKYLKLHFDKLFRLTKIYSTTFFFKL